MLNIRYTVFYAIEITVTGEKVTVINQKEFKNELQCCIIYCE